MIRGRRRLYLSRESPLALCAPRTRRPCCYRERLRIALHVPDAPSSRAAPPAAGSLGRDYGIDASNVLSMNVDSVETVTGGIDAQSPDFAQAVNDPANWEHYAQRTYSAAFTNSEGYILSEVVGSSPSIQGYYRDVTVLPGDGKGTPKDYYLTKMLRNSRGGFTGYGLYGSDASKYLVPAGTTTEELLDPNGQFRLSGAVYSYVLGDQWDGNREDYYGWYGTALLNNNEYDADNIDASFRLVQGGNLNEGFCFLVNKSDVTDIVHYKGNDLVVPRLSGYFMSVCSHNNRPVRTLWRFDDYELDLDSTPQAHGIWCGEGYAGHKELWYAGNQYSFIPTTRNNDVTQTQKPQTITALATWSDDAQNIDYNVKADGKSIVVTRKDNGAETDSAPPAVPNTVAGDYGFPGIVQEAGITFKNKRDVEEIVADIEVTDNGDGTTSYQDKVSGKGSTVGHPNLTRGTYGFWGQNCEMGNQALITNLSVKINKTIVKSFGNIVEEPAWTEGALHMLINIDSEADSTMLVGADAGRREMAGSHR